MVFAVPLGIGTNWMFEAAPALGNMVSNRSWLKPSYALDWISKPPLIGDKLGHAGRQGLNNIKPDLGRFHLQFVQGIRWTQAHGAYFAMAMQPIILATLTINVTRQTLFHVLDSYSPGGVITSPRVGRFTRRLSVFSTITSATSSSPPMSKGSHPPLAPSFAGVALGIYEPVCRRYFACCGLHFAPSLAEQRTYPTAGKPCDFRKSLWIER